DFLFDDRDWKVRYIVVDTGWLFGRRVLLAPEAVERIDPDREEIAFSLTKRQIENGPGVTSDLPVSRQHEIDLREHYGWPRYWELYPAGAIAPPLIPALRRQGATSETAAEAEDALKNKRDPNLRSVREVEGYHIEARDGEIGHV